MTTEHIYAQRRTSHSPIMGKWKQNRERRRTQENRRQTTRTWNRGGRYGGRRRNTERHDPRR